MPMILQTAQEDQKKLKLNGTYQLLAYIDGINLLGKNIYIYKKYFGFNCNKSTSDNNTAKYEMLSTLKYKSDNRRKPHTHTHIEALLVTSEEVGL